jgi:hypothetical protein
VRVARYVIAVVLALLVAGSLVLFACHGDREISTEVLIDGSPRTVWQVLTATSAYPSWNPMIARIVGDLREGNIIEVDEGMIFHPRILAFRAEQELRWKGHVWVPGIFDGEHRFVLEPLGDRTRLIQSERFTGILAGKITNGIIDETVNAMNGMNSALKARAESSAQFQ